MPTFTALNREVYAGVDRFMASCHVRVIGYTSTYVPTVLAQLGGDQPSAIDILFYATVVGGSGIIVMLLLLKV